MLIQPSILLHSTENAISIHWICPLWKISPFYIEFLKKHWANESEKKRISTRMLFYHVFIHWHMCYWAKSLHFLSLFTFHSCACVSLFDIRSARTIPFVVVCKRENDKWKQRWRNNKSRKNTQKYCEEPECVRCVWWIVQLRLVFEVVADMNSTGLDVQM